MKSTDVVIIGAGIAGVTCAIYLRSFDIDFVLIDGSEVGGKLLELSDIENFPSKGKTTGKDIAQDLANHLEHLNIKVVSNNVQTILKDKEGFEVKTDGETYVAKKVVLATGNSKVSTSIKGEQDYIGRGVSYCAVCDGNFFKGSDVLVVGNSNTAMEEAIYLSNIVDKVYFVSPSELIGDETLISKLENLSNVTIFKNKVVDEILGDNFGVTSFLMDGQEINVSGVFPYLGKKSSSQILKNLNPNMNGEYVITDQNMMSNIDGLYAIGDIRFKKLRQLVTASSDGAIAAVHISSNK